MRNKRILIPIIILLIILSSWAFRWDIMATKSTDYGVFKWTRDRWSNTVIYEKYKPGVYNTTTARRGWTNPNTATLHMAKFIRRQWDLVVGRIP